MRLRNIFENNQFYLLIYKLLYDLLFLVIVAAFVSIIIEGAIPGFLSQHLSPLRVNVVLVFLLFVISLLGNKLAIDYPQKTSRKSPLVAFSVIFLFLIVGNSMLKFALWQNLIITLTTMAVAFLLYKTLISPKD